MCCNGVISLRVYLCSLREKLPGNSLMKPHWEPCMYFCYIMIKKDDSELIQYIEGLLGKK